jgi:hypothetical protein
MNGKLGSKRLAINTPELIYTVPTAATATVNVSVCNCANTNVAIRIAISTGSTPVDADWIEYDAAVSGNGGIERAGLVLSAGEKVFVQANSASVSARVHGFEEGAV